MRADVLRSTAAAWLTATVTLLSCAVPSDLLDDRPCPCGEGWSCDARNVCVEGRPDGPPPVPTTCWQVPSGCEWGEDGSFEFVPDDGSVYTSPDRSANHMFSPDGCSIFHRVSEGTLDLYVAERPGPTAAFGAETPLVDINTPSAGEDKATISPDGLELFYTSDLLGTNDIYRSRRNAVGEPWSTGEYIGVLNAAGFDTFDVALAPHGTRIYFARPVGNPNQDLVVAARPGLGAEFEPPARIDEVSTSSFSEAEPAVTADDLVLTYVTRPTGTALQMHYATRADWNDPWVPRGPIPGTFLAEGNETEGTVSPDGCELIVRREGVGIVRLTYRAIR